MWLLILEAFIALLLLIGLVAWTMSGRRRTPVAEPGAEAGADAPPPQRPGER